MKLRTLIATVLFSICSAGLASAADIYPPERITCKLTKTDKMRCYDFNRQYFVEDVSSANLKRGEFQTFNFIQATAYINGAQSDSSVTITYNNPENQTVRLKGLNLNLTPDFDSNNWIMVKPDVYVCEAGYLGCGIKMKR